MIGVVLCGGESKRMGSDKGLLKQGNNAWAQIVASNIISLQIPTLISVNKTQIDLYSQIFSADQLVMDKEGLPVKGPLLGLLSTHQQFPGEDLLVLACDMINMQDDVLQNLLATYKEEAFQACVFTINGKIQPLCGVYTSGGLEHILDLCFKNQLQKFSMMYALECLNTKYISANNFTEYFANYNSAEEISTIKSIG